MYKLRIVKGTLDFSKFSDEDKIGLSSFEQEIIEEIESDYMFSVLTIREQREKLDKYVPKITRERAEMCWLETKDTEKEETVIHEYSYPIYREFSVISWVFSESPSKKGIFEELDIIDGCRVCRHCTPNGVGIAYCNGLDDWCVNCRDSEKGCNHAFAKSYTEEGCEHFERSYSKLERTLYEAYKIDWLKRISMEEHVNAFLSWCEDDNYEGFEEYLEEKGFNGSIYACFDEFLENEFLDKEYIKGIIGHKEKVYSEYLEFLKKREIENL